MKILMFNAIWCSGCIVMKNVMKDVLKLYPDIVLESYDYDMETEMVDKWNVGNIIPVLIFLDSSGNEVIRLNGEKSKKEVIKVIEGLML